MLARVGSLFLMAALVVGCDSPPVPTSSSVLTASPAVAPPTQEELEAIRFRTEMSLQSDLEHVRAVAADPSAGMEFGVPLLPSEFDELMSRSASVEEIIPIIQAEAAKAPNDYCGLYIDNANQGALTSGWTNNLLIHELAIRSQLRPGAKVAFIPCQFSETAVNGVCDRLREVDHDWMAAIPAEVMGYGCGNMHFRVEMSISSEVPDAARQVDEHYSTLLALPPGMFVVESDGTGVSLVKRGTLRVFVTSPDGGPVGESTLSLMFQSDVPGLACGEMVGYGVRGDGKPSEVPCQEGRWVVQVVESLDDIYGEATVVVKANKTVDVHITLDREPPPIA